MKTEPIDELLEKKLTSKKKLTTQVEDAKDSVRRATNKLEEKTEALEKREDEIRELQSVREDLVKVFDQMREIDELFMREYVEPISIDAYNEIVKEAVLRKNYDTPPPKPELREPMKEYYALQASIEDYYARARKIYYNR